MATVKRRVDFMGILKMNSNPLQYFYHLGLGSSSIRIILTL